MWSIIGLGNPGEEYVHTRHNAGRRLLEFVVKKNSFDPFMFDKKINALTTKGIIEGERVQFILPETFMNKSGNSLKVLRIRPKHVLLIHDDSDLPIGRMKLSFGKRSAGHRGVDSINRALKTRDYWRLRIGIQRKKRVPAEDLVLMKFSPVEEKILNNVFKNATKALNTFLSSSPERAMTEFNAH